jgi:hypothetical protein
MWIVSLLTPPPSKATIDKYFNREEQAAATESPVPATA